jgi:hypothetical protein
VNRVAAQSSRGSTSHALCKKRLCSPTLYGLSLTDLDIYLPHVVPTLMGMFCERRSGALLTFMPIWVQPPFRRVQIASGHRSGLRD